MIKPKTDWTSLILYFLATGIVVFSIIATIVTNIKTEPCTPKECIISTVAGNIKIQSMQSINGVYVLSNCSITPDYAIAIKDTTQCFENKK